MGADDVQVRPVSADESRAPCVVEGSLAGRLELGVRRFYMPGVTVRSRCPKCSRAWRRKMSEDYFPYPTAGEPFPLRCYCRDGSCGHEWNVMLRLDVTLSAVEPEGPR